jgi:hypothetical protein
VFCLPTISTICSLPPPFWSSVGCYPHPRVSPCSSPTTLPSTQATLANAAAAVPPVTRPPPTREEPLPSLTPHRSRSPRPRTYRRSRPRRLAIAATGDRSTEFSGNEARAHRHELCHAATQLHRRRHVRRWKYPFPSRTHASRRTQCNSMTRIDGGCHGEGKAGRGGPERRWWLRVQSGRACRSSAPGRLTTTSASWRPSLRF